MMASLPWAHRGLRGERGVGRARSSCVGVRRRRTARRNWPPRAVRGEAENASSPAQRRGLRGHTTGAWSGIGAPARSRWWPSAHASRPHRCGQEETPAGREKRAARQEQPWQMEWV